MQIARKNLPVAAPRQLIDALEIGAREIILAPRQGDFFFLRRHHNVVAACRTQRNRLAGRLTLGAAIVKKPVEQIQRKNRHRQIAPPKVGKRIETKSQIANPLSLMRKDQSSFAGFHDDFARHLRGQGAGYGK